MKKGLLFITAALVSVIVFSCATIFKGASEDVGFTSDPGGAQVYVNGEMKGTTPVNFKLESKKSYTVEFRKEGYETKAFHIDNSISAGYVVLDVLCGFVPIVVDAATGSWYKLDQTKIDAVLQKK